MADQAPETSTDSAITGKVELPLRWSHLFQIYQSTKRMLNGTTTAQPTDTTTPLNEEWVMLDPDSDDDATIVVEDTKETPATPPEETKDCFQQEAVVGGAQRSNLNETQPAHRESSPTSYEAARAKLADLRRVEETLYQREIANINRDSEARLAWNKWRARQPPQAMSKAKGPYSPTGPSPEGLFTPPAEVAETKAEPPESKTDKQPRGRAPDGLNSRQRWEQSEIKARAPPLYREHPSPDVVRCGTRRTQVPYEDIYNASPPRSRRRPARIFRGQEKHWQLHSLG
ncbi:hypothetical protein B0T19DRAFT_401571 [Cercophora scortea]|uniref:Uncharacterized protein n=1 Tax=Cercophora scortea TaxID=314031 RepID=A0AAE0IDL6_9PEZI|nr:hypothetical protein B0T19DRAFT_401571 [Cercophora scortea]